MTEGKEKTRAKKSQIPEFTRIEEEAEFWDTHDFTDFSDELKPARVTFSQRLTNVLAIRLDSQTLAELRKQANSKGIGPTTLARMWILEHLEGTRKPPAQ